MDRALEARRRRLRDVQPDRLGRGALALAMLTALLFHTPRPAM